MSEIEVQFEKATPGGKALGRINDKIIFAHDVLPGEKALVKITKDKKDFYHGQVIKITHPSPHRIAPKEDHYLTCSPWQIADYHLEKRMKSELLQETFERIGKSNIPVTKFTPSPLIFGYRNKLVFSFTEENNDLQLAFYRRGTSQKKIPLPTGCALADPIINETALAVIEKLNQASIPLSSLKNLMVRSSKTTQKTIATLFWTTENFSDLDPDSIPHLAGLHHFYSRPGSPNNTYDRSLKSSGEKELSETIGSLKIAYPFDAFFQNNLTILPTALDRIRTYCLPIQKNIHELYSGVGTIGLYLADLADQVQGLEISSSANTWANKNAKINGIENFFSCSGTDQKISSTWLSKSDILILDPPRPGLHPKVIKRILEVKPQRIIYLSCDPVTQARDFFRLKNDYEPLALEGFDFYPQTPHLESLLVLDLK